MSLPTVSRLEYGVDYHLSAKETQTLLLRDCVSYLPEYSDSFFSVVDCAGRCFTITRFKKEDVTPPLNQKVIWAWQKVSALAVYNSGPSVGQSAREDLYGFEITCTQIDGTSDAEGHHFYEVFAQSIKK